MGKVVKLGTEKQIKYATEEIIQTKYFCSHCPDCYYWDNCGSMEGNNLLSGTTGALNLINTT